MSPAGHWGSDPSTPRFLVSYGEHLALCPDGPLWVDVEAFEEAAATAVAEGRCRSGRGLGWSCCRDHYEDWAEERRTELRTLYLTLLWEVAELHEADGNLGAATGTLQKIVVHEPAHEAAHARLMRLYALAGQRYQALRQYEQLEGNLLRELGAAPRKRPQADISTTRSLAAECRPAARRTRRGIRLGDPRLPDTICPSLSPTLSGESARCRRSSTP